MAARQAQLAALRADIAKGQATAKQLPEFRAQVDRSRRRGSSSLSAVLPEEKDAADLLRRMQTVATQSNLDDQELQAGADRSPSSCTPSGRSRCELEGTYHNLAIFFDRVGKFTRIINISGARRARARTSPTPNATITRDLRRDDVRAARQAGAAEAGATPRRPPRRSRPHEPCDASRCCFSC